ncbi:MAG: hypothetical protein Q4A24_10685 [Akkermansia sp.]|nr:hypothetical protein [Akkermansia sp.]
MNTFSPDFRIQHSTALMLGAIPIVGIIIALAPDAWGYENGVLENLQLALILYGGALCLTAKDNKALYLCIAAILFAMLMREVNCGRVLFWSKCGDSFVCAPPSEYLKWQDIPHGQILHYGAYTATALLCVFSLLRNSVRQSLRSLLRSTHLPCWEAIILILATLAHYYTEQSSCGFVAEESMELLVYAAVISTIHRYSRGLQTRTISASAHQHAL